MWLDTFAPRYLPLPVKECESLEGVRVSFNVSQKCRVCSHAFHLHRYIVVNSLVTIAWRLFHFSSQDFFEKYGTERYLGNFTVTIYPLALPESWLFHNTHETQSSNSVTVLPRNPSGMAFGFHSIASNLLFGFLGPLDHTALHQIKHLQAKICIPWRNPIP